MYIVIFSSLLALLFTYLESKGQMKSGMKIGFVLVTFLGAIHYDYGSDYMSYLNLYNEVTSYNFDLEGILAKDYFNEPGWVLLCWAFKYIGGFFMMVAVLNIVQNYIVYRFINEYVERKWWPFAIFIYLFDTSFYLMSFSMMRQSFVIFVFLGMWKFIRQRKWWIPLIVLYICSYIHSSAIVLLPFAFWGYIPIKRNKIIVFGYVFLFALLWFAKGFLNDLFQYAVALNEDISYLSSRYDMGRNNGLKLGVGFIVNMIPLLLSILYIFNRKKTVSDASKLLVSLSTISYFIIPFSQIILLVSRLSMYFGIYNIGSVPIIYNNIENKIIKKMLILIFVFLMLYNYYLFFNSEIWISKYTYFHTIFSQF